MLTVVLLVHKMSSKTYRCSVVFSQKEIKPSLMPDDQEKPVDSNKGGKQIHLETIFLCVGSLFPKGWWEVVYQLGPDRSLGTPGSTDLTLALETVTPDSS